jgi:hypothetical protein
MTRCVEACTEPRGRHFRHLLYKCTFSAGIHKLNVSGHMFIWNFFFLCVRVWNSCQNLSVHLSYPLYNLGQTERVKAKQEVVAVMDV